MKIVVSIAVAVGLIGLGFYLFPQEKTISASRPVTQQPAPNAVITDPVDVFQKAFWRRPTAEDRIVNAERREWSDENGISKWEWFIKVEASPSLIQYLREENAFGLVPGAAVPSLENAPSWFKFSSAHVDVLGAPSGNLRFVFSKTDNTLNATDSGGGFHPGAPESPQIPQTPTPATEAGRLPNSPPPRRNL